MSGVVDLIGFRELDKALGELPRATARNVLRRIGRAALEPLANQASAHAPVGRGVLAFSITVSERGTRRARWAREIDRRGSFTIAMGPAGGQGALNYASFAEFGTVNMPAKPFLRPVWDAGQGQALDYVKAELWGEISRASARLARKAARAAA